MSSTRQANVSIFSAFFDRFGVYVDAIDQSVNQLEKRRLFADKRHLMRRRVNFAIESASGFSPTTRTAIVSVKSDIEIAQAAEIRPIAEIAAKIDIPF